MAISTNKVIDDILRAGDTAIGAKVRTQLRVLGLGAKANANPVLSRHGERILRDPSPLVPRALIALASDAAVRADYVAWSDAGKPTDGTANDIDVLLTDAQVAAIITEAFLWTAIAETL